MTHFETNVKNPDISDWIRKTVLRIAVIWSKMPIASSKSLTHRIISLWETVNGSLINKTRGYS